MPQTMNLRHFYFYKLRNLHGATRVHVLGVGNKNTERKLSSVMFTRFWLYSNQAPVPDGRGNPSPPERDV